MYGQEKIRERNEKRDYAACYQASKDYQRDYYLRRKATGHYERKKIERALHAAA
jgi:hypothetical protein